MKEKTLLKKLSKKQRYLYEKEIKKKSIQNEKDKKTLFNSLFDIFCGNSPKSN